MNPQQKQLSDALGDLGREMLGDVLQALFGPEPPAGKGAGPNGQATIEAEAEPSEPKRLATGFFDQPGSSPEAVLTIGQDTLQLQELRRIESALCEAVRAIDASFDAGPYVLGVVVAYLARQASDASGEPVSQILVAMRDRFKAGLSDALEFQLKQPKTR